MDGIPLEPGWSFSTEWPKGKKHACLLGGSIVARVFCRCLLTQQRLTRTRRTLVPIS